jgi:hypothetical protein
MIELNLNQAIDQLRGLNQDLSPREFKKAIRLGLNDGIKKSRTLMVREVLAHYNNTAFTSSGVRSAISLNLANAGNLTASLGLSGKPISLAYFGARKTKTGVSVEILKGQRKIIKSAFMLKAGGRGRNIPFARGKYEGNKFQFRKNREVSTGPDLPIGKLLSISIPSAVRSNDVPILLNIQRELEPFTIARITHHIEQIKLGTY